MEDKKGLTLEVEQWNRSVCKFSTIPGSVIIGQLLRLMRPQKTVMVFK